MTFSNFIQRIEISFWVFTVSLMKKKGAKRYVFLLLLLVLSLSVGAFSAVYKVYSQENDSQVIPASTVSDTTVPLRTETSQHNILVILVDRLVEPSPSLEGVWLVVYLPDTPHLTFLPIFPLDSDDQVLKDSTLTGHFRLVSSGEPAPAFLKAIEAKDIRWDEILVFDKVSLAVLIDLSGGLDSAQGLVSGTQAVAQLPAARNDPQTALENQAILAREICQKMDNLLHNSDTARLLELLAGRGYSETEFVKHFPGWSHFQEFGGDISCEFPTFIGISLLAPAD